MKTNLEILIEIAFKFGITHTRTITTIAKKNGLVYQGHFQNFDDYNDLLKKYQLRFIPLDKAAMLKSDYEKNGKYTNKENSIVIDVRDVQQIELVTKYKL